MLPRQSQVDKQPAEHPDSRDEKEKGQDTVFLLTSTGSCFINNHNLF
jgi:hypothetical protein